MDTKTLLKKVRAIEIKTRRLSDHVFGGEYHSTFKGRGMTFSEVRKYEYGDDVPLTWRDPRPEFNGPQETGTDPRNPARYSAPTQLLAGIQIKW